MTERKDALSGTEGEIASDFDKVMELLKKAGLKANPIFAEAWEELIHLRSLHAAQKARIAELEVERDGMLTGMNLTRERTEARLSTIRAETIEECAKVADAHRGAASRERKARGSRVMHFASEEAKQAVMDEERGETIASEMIGKAIRSLATPQEEKR